MTSSFTFNPKLPLGPLTAIAIADAMASGGEFVDRFPKPDALEYRQHTMWPYMAAGHYSDDTQLTLAVAEWMLESNAPLQLERYLVKIWARDPRGGSPRMQAAFEEAIETGKRLERCLVDKTDGSGAAMRAGLFGWHSASSSQLMDKVGEQATITHSGDGVLAAQAAALMVSLTAWSDCPKIELGESIAAILGDERFHFSGKPAKPSNKGVDCVRAALWVLQESSTLTQIIQNALDMGGDTDTVAVIAMGAAWFSPQYENDIPYKFWFGLENGPYGRSYLRKVEMEMLDKGIFKKPGTMAKRKLRVA